MHYFPTARLLFFQILPVELLIDLVSPSLKKLMVCFGLEMVGLTPVTWYMGQKDSESDTLTPLSLDSRNSELDIIQNYK